MRNLERPSEELVVENQEQTAEQTPEQAIGAAVAPLEIREAADPIVSSEWGKKSGKYLKSAGGLAVAGARVGLVYLPYKITVGLLRFAKKAIEKKGKVGFKGGYEIGKEAFSFDGKNDKK